MEEEDDFQPEQKSMLVDSEYDGRSKTNSVSTNQFQFDQEKLLHKENKQSVNRVCCFQIQKNWTIKKQMLISLCILSGSVLILVLLIVNGNVFLTKFLIENSSEDAIDSQVTENLHNSATEYSSAILEIFTGYSSTLEILSRIVLSAMKKDDSIFDYEYVKEFPIIGPGYLDGQDDYYNFYDNEEFPESLTKSHLQYPDNYPGREFTYDKWQYGAFSNDDLKAESDEAIEILKAADILNYFLEDFYFNKQVTHIQNLYFAWETEQLFMFYPGGILNKTALEGYSPHQTQWYQKTKNVYEEDPSLKLEMIITGPYWSYKEVENLITISKAIVDKDGNFMGVCSIDMLFQDLQTIISKVRFYETGFLVLVSVQNDYILNDPYGKNTNIQIYQTNVTGLDETDWEKIKDASISEDQRLIFKDKSKENPDDNEIIIIRNFIQTNVPSQDFVLIVQVPKSEAYKFLTELRELMNETFKEIQIYTFVAIVVTCLLSIFSGMYYSNRIVTPLAQLTEYAKSINQNATKKSFAENIKIDLDSIKAQDKIGELIEAFKSLVKGLSGLKKGARTEISAGNEKITFPKNYYQNTKMSWRPLIDQLKDYDLDEDLDIDGEINGENQSNSKKNVNKNNKEKENCEAKCNENEINGNDATETNGYTNNNLDNNDFSNNKQKQQSATNKSSTNKDDQDTFPNIEEEDNQTQIKNKIQGFKTMQDLQNMKLNKEQSQNQNGKENVIQQSFIDNLMQPASTKRNLLDRQKGSSDELNDIINNQQQKNQNGGNDSFMNSSDDQNKK